MRWVTGFFLCLLASVAHAQYRPLTAQVAANLGVTGYTIPAGFVGLSGEAVDLVTAGYYQGSTGANGSYCSLVNLLGSTGSFRLGGNSSDLATPPALTQGIANNLNSFVSCLGANWKLIYGLNMRAANYSLAATQAGYIATAFGGGANVVFQFGNEVLGGYLSKTAYQTAWNSEYSSVSGTVSPLTVAGPDSEDFGDVQNVIPNLTPGTPTIITQHWYGSYNSNPYTVTSASQLISTVAINYWVNAGLGSATPPVGVNGNNAWIVQNGYTQRMSESNSINSLGLTGFSNVMASATWYLNQAIFLSNNSWVGINTHNTYTSAGVGIYNPIVSLDGGNTFQAAPEFYGLYLFSKIEGQQTVAVSVGGNANINAIATKGGNGNANILAVNNDPFHPSIVTPSQSSAWTTANVLLFSGASCYDVAPTIGGAIIGPSGSWSGSSYAISNGSTISIPPCGAALIQIQP